jgi:hypothetical protein
VLDSWIDDTRNDLADLMREIYTHERLTTKGFAEAKCMLETALTTTHRPLISLVFYLLKFPQMEKFIVKYQNPETNNTVTLTDIAILQQIEFSQDFLEKSVAHLSKF